MLLLDHVRHSSDVASVYRGGDRATIRKLHLDR